MTHVSSDSSDGAIGDRPYREPAVWPTVIGVLSLIYAAGGLLCQGGAGVMTLMPGLPLKLMGIDVDLEIPLINKVVPGVQIALTFALGVFLVIAAIKLLRRRPGARQLLQRWAILRLLLLVLGVPLGLVMLPSQLQLQEQIMEATNDMLRENGQAGSIQEWDSDALWQRSIYSMVGMTVVLAVVPLTFGILMSARFAREESETWF